jgi:hypothetical protein
VNARDTGLRDQEAQLAAQERQMQELVVVQKGMEDLWASRAGDR